MKLSIPFSNTSRRTIFPDIRDHSVRSDFTGFAIAAFIAWKLIVANAINTASNPANRNIHHDIFMR